MIGKLMLCCFIMWVVLSKFLIFQTVYVSGSTDIRAKELEFKDMP